MQEIFCRFFKQEYTVIDSYNDLGAIEKAFLLEPSYRKLTDCDSY